MSLVDVNRVTLGDTNDSKQAMSNVILLFASFIYDEIENKEYIEALKTIEALKVAIPIFENLLNGGKS